MDDVDRYLADWYRRKNSKGTAAAQPQQALDVQKVAALAQDYQREQRKAGREVSATDAVAHVMAHRR